MTCAKVILRGYNATIKYVKSSTKYDIVLGLSFWQCT
jgi:hypothetical protein